MTFATLYVACHGLVVFVLGFAAIVLSGSLPSGVDSVMERVVGATLVSLGVHVLIAVARRRNDFRMRSRWMLVFAAGRRWRRSVLRRRSRDQVVVVEHAHDHRVGAHHVSEVDVAVAGAEAGVTPSGPLHYHHDHRHGHVALVPEDPFMNYGRTTAFAVGTLHGVGAETPTQVVVFLAAASVGGRGRGC